MASSERNSSVIINSMIGEGTRFKGELELDGLLRIDGDFSGSIKTTGKVLIGYNGRAECIIHANTIIIGGIIKGNIYSKEKVIILSTGMVIGNIYAPRIIIEEGVIFDGVLTIISPEKLLLLERRQKNHQIQIEHNKSGSERVFSYSDLHLQGIDANWFEKVQNFAPEQEKVTLKS